MNGTVELGFAGVVATLFVQLLKFLTRKFIVKDMEFDFHEVVYIVGIPAVAFLFTPLLAWLGVPEYGYPADVVVWLKEGTITTIAAFAAYYLGVNPLKEYRKAMVAKRNGE